MTITGRPATDRTVSGFPRLGDAIGPYRLVRGLGTGGRKVVFGAVDERDGREVALEIPLVGPFSGEETRQALGHEARVLEMLDTPFAPRLIESRIGDQPPVLVLELIEGPSLAERLRRGALPETGVLELASALRLGLADLHAAGVAHGDVKPAHILGDGERGYRLIDFSEAVVLPNGRAHDPAPPPRAATLAFAAPERLRGEAGSPAGDWWALGASLYLAATSPGFRGRAPAGDPRHHPTPSQPPAPEPLGRARPSRARPARQSARAPRGPRGVGAVSLKGSIAESAQQGALVSGWSAPVPG